MLPLVCNDAVAILFMFDLSRKATLNSVKEWSGLALLPPPLSFSFIDSASFLFFSLRYRQARGFNKTAIPFLIGTKFDKFSTLPDEEKEEITQQVRGKLTKRNLISSCGPEALRFPSILFLSFFFFSFFFSFFFLFFFFFSFLLFSQARKYAKAMKAPLIFCSAFQSIHVQKIFKIVLSKSFDLKCTVPRIETIGAPILEY